MSDFLVFVRLGVGHILDPAALDHVLFLLALAAIYRLADWRKAAWVVTAFTVGHSITLALAVTGAVSLPTALIEFLIPVTIVATGIDNLLLRPGGGDGASRWRRPLITALFGLVHGAGFANYLKALFLSDIAVPLAGFNVGIEAGQLVAFSILAALLGALDLLISRARPLRSEWDPVRVRTIAVSLLVVGFAAVWAVQRYPR